MDEGVELEEHRVCAHMGPEKPCEHKHPHTLTSRKQFKLPNAYVIEPRRGKEFDREEFAKQKWRVPPPWAFVSQPRYGFEMRLLASPTAELLVSGRRIKYKGGTFPLKLSMLTFTQSGDIVDGGRTYYKYHSFDDEPAYSFEGFAVWMHQGRIHREKGPAIIAPCGSMLYLVNGFLHRSDGPACVWSCGREEWFSHGMRTNAPGGPGYHDLLGTKIWYDDGVVSRMFTKTGWVIIAVKHDKDEIDQNFRVMKGNVDVLVKRGNTLKTVEPPPFLNKRSCVTLDIYRKDTLVLRKKILQRFKIYCKSPVEGENRLPFLLQLLGTMKIPKCDGEVVII